MARNAIPAPDVSVASAFRRQKSTIISKNCRSFSRNFSPANPSKQSPCTICIKQFNLYREGPRGWNTKPYTLCIDCFRTRRHTKHNNFPSPTLIAIPGASESNSHLATVTKTAPPLLEEQAKILLQESGSFENEHYVFQNGQWIKAGMRDHPTVKVYISMDNSWCRSRHALIVARNVIAIADTGAQTNEWSLRNFLAAGFNRSILISASDLVAANHSGVKIEFFSPL